MLSPRNIAISRTGSLLVVMYASFRVGGYAVSFSGSKWAWIAVTSFLVLSIVASVPLLRVIWHTAYGK